MNIFRIIPITVLSLFVMGCGLTTTGDSDGNATLPASNETKQNFEDREYDDRRGNDHEKAMEELCDIWKAISPKPNSTGLKIITCFT